MVNHVKLQNIKIVDPWEFSPPQFIATLVPTMIFFSQGALMNLRLLYSLGILSVAALQADCSLVCNNDSCDPSIDILKWCATSGQCHVNGQLVTTCEDISGCPFDEIKPDTHYEIPLDKLWPTAGSRNDFAFRCWDGKIDEDSDIAILIDGVPATDTECKHEFFTELSKVTCPNLSRSRKRLEFEFIPPPSGVIGDLNIEIYAGDTECSLANPGCD